MNTYAPATTSIAVVATIGQSVALTRAGIAATTFRDILAQPDPVTIGYFDGAQATLFVTLSSARIAGAVENRLRRLGIPVRVTRELLDRSHR